MAQSLYVHSKNNDLSLKDSQKYISASWLYPCLFSANKWCADIIIELSYPYISEYYALMIGWDYYGKKSLSTSTNTPSTLAISYRRVSAWHNRLANNIEGSWWEQMGSMKLIEWRFWRLLSSDTPQHVRFLNFSIIRAHNMILTFLFRQLYNIFWVGLPWLHCLMVPKQIKRHNYRT